MYPVLFLATVTMVLLFAFRTQQQTGDSLGYAYWAETGQRIFQPHQGPQFFHPHHMLFVPSIRILWQAISCVYDSFNMLLAAQLHNILWAVSGMVSAYYLVKYLFCMTSVALLVGLCFLLFRGFWELSTVSTMYVPTIASMMILSATLLLYENKSSRRFVFLLATTLSLCILQHQFNVLFCVPIMLYLFFVNGHKGLTTSMKIISLSGLMVLILYLLAFVHGNGNRWSFSGFLGYCLQYAASAKHDWGTFANLRIQGFEVLLRSQIWTIIGPSSKILFYFMVLGVTTICIWNAVYIFKKSSYFHVRIFFFSWLSIYLLFFLWWLPSYRHLFLVTSFPMFILFLLLLVDIGDMFKHKAIFLIITLTLTLVMLVYVNSPGALRRHKYPNNSYVSASSLVEISQLEDTIITSYDAHQHLWYYFGRRNMRQFNGVLLSFYRPHLYPDRDQLDGASNIILPIRYLSPDYTITLKRYNARTRPSEWLGLISWLFDCQTDEDNRLMSCRKFRMITASDNTPYLMILPERMAIANVSELLKRLDIEF